MVQKKLLSAFLLAQFTLVQPAQHLASQALPYASFEWAQKNVLFTKSVLSDVRKERKNHGLLPPKMTQNEKYLFYGLAAALSVYTGGISYFGFGTDETSGRNKSFIPAIISALGTTLVMHWIKLPSEAPSVTAKDNKFHSDNHELAGISELLESAREEYWERRKIRASYKKSAFAPQLASAIALSLWGILAYFMRNSRVSREMSAVVSTAVPLLIVTILSTFVVSKFRRNIKPIFEKLSNVEAEIILRIMRGDKFSIYALLRKRGVKPTEALRISVATIKSVLASPELTFRKLKRIGLASPRDGVPSLRTIGVVMGSTPKASSFESYLARLRARVTASIVEVTSEDFDEIVKEVYSEISATPLFSISLKSNSPHDFAASISPGTETEVDEAREIVEMLDGEIAEIQNATSSLIELCVLLGKSPRDEKRLAELQFLLSKMRNFKEHFTGIVDVEKAAAIFREVEDSMNGSFFSNVFNRTFHETIALAESESLPSSLVERRVKRLLKDVSSSDISHAESKLSSLMVDLHKAENLCRKHPSNKRAVELEKKIFKLKKRISRALHLIRLIDSEKE